MTMDLIFDLLVLAFFFGSGDTDVCLSFFCLFFFDRT